MLYNVYMLYNNNCSVYTLLQCIHCTMHTVHCTVYIVQCTYSVHCITLYTLYNVTQLYYMDHDLCLSCTCILRLHLLSTLFGVHCTAYTVLRTTKETEQSVRTPQCGAVVGTMAVVFITVFYLLQAIDNHVINGDRGHAAIT